MAWLCFSLLQLLQGTQEHVLAEWKPLPAARDKQKPGGQVLASVTLGMHVTYKLSSDWAHRLTELPEGA